jgi:hypothetical protein
MNDVFQDLDNGFLKAKNQLSCHSKCTYTFVRIDWGGELFASLKVVSHSAPATTTQPRLLSGTEIIALEFIWTFIELYIQQIDSRGRILESEFMRRINHDTPESFDFNE